MNEIEEIKDRINIVDFISNYIELHKAGSNYRGLCPFHKEKTPSFMVSPEKQFFNCFGCSEHGDIFDFLQKIENLSFPEALEMLADKAGVILSKHNKKTKQQIETEKDEKTLCYKINKTSAHIFHQYLKNGRESEIVKKYLKKRKINKETIDKFLIGFAPKKRIISQYFFTKKINTNNLKKSGDPQKFINRITFPIFDIIGNIVGFTGRTIDDKIQPKYLNTPETIIFHKSKILYGFNFAKNEIKNKNNAILVEGQMDVISSHQAGIKNVIASSGTALTHEHLKIISRISPNISFCFDNDLAGYNATLKAVGIAYTANLTPFVIEIPKDYKDVGEIVEKNPLEWKETSNKKIPAFDWIIKKTFDKYNNLNTNNKKNIAKELIPYLTLISDPIEQKHYKKIIAQKLVTTEQIINEIIEKHQNNNAKPLSENNPKSILSKNADCLYETLLGLLLIYPKYISLLLNNIDFENISNKTTKQIYKIVFDCYNKIDRVKFDIDDFSNYVKSKLDKSLEKEVNFLIIQTQEKEKKLSESEIKQEIIDYIAKIKAIKNQKIKNKYAALISEAENKKDIKELKKLLTEFQKQISK